MVVWLHACILQLIRVGGFRWSDVEVEKENSDFKPGALGRSKGSSGYPPGSWPPNLPAFVQRATGDTSAVSCL